MGGVPVIGQVAEAVGSVTGKLGPVGDLISGVANPGELLGKLGFNPMDIIGGLLPDGVAELLQNPLVQMAISTAFPPAGAAIGMLGGGGGGLTAGGFAGGSFDLGAVADLV